MSAIKPTNKELDQRVKSLESELKDCQGVKDALKESEKGYRAIVEGAPGAIMAIRNGCFLFVNPAGARMLGFSDPEEMVGAVEIELIRQDGSKIIAETISVSTLMQGKPTGVIIAKDITEIKQAQEALKDHLRFQELVAKISTKFTGLYGIEFEQAIQGTLAEIGRYFMVDAVRLYRLSPKGDVLKIRNMWRAERLAPEEEMPEIHKMKYPNLASHYSRGESVVFSRFEDSPEWPEIRKILKFFGTKAGVGVPLEIDDSGVDVFAMDKVLSEHVWPKDIVEYSKAIGSVILGAMRRREAEVELQESYDEIKQLKDRLEQENISLRHEIEIQYRHDEIVGDSDAMKDVLSQTEMVAKQNTSVLILGETGTGKELLARAIHNISPRKNRAMIKVNCAALPATLIESELFGREKGAFTGALTRQVGRFEAANGSTIFLDEIGDLPLEMQAKLLRVLHDGQFERLGSAESVTVDVRVIAATNHNLEQEMREGRFRQDLFYRLSVFPITVPPLRDRREDIPQLIWSFVREFGESMGKSIAEISKKDMDMLKNYSWPGNVRELKNIIERAMILSTGTTLHLDQVGSKDVETIQSTTLEGVEKSHILEILENTGWKISGRNGAAEVLGLKESTLRARMKKLGIQRKK